MITTADRHDITEALLKVALNTINQSNQKNLANINISTWPNINYSKRNPNKHNERDLNSLL
jgi:hypothetical protein